MKHSFYAVLLLFFVSCNSQETSNSKADCQSKTDLFIDSFVAKHPDINKNDLAYEAANKDWISESESFVLNHGLDDLPLEAVAMKRIDSNKIIVHFNSVKRFKTDGQYHHLDQVDMDLLVSFTQEVANTISQEKGNLYYLHYDKAQLIKDSKDITFFTDRMVNTPAPIILSGGYCFGNYIINGLSVDKVKKHYTGCYYAKDTATH